MMAAYKDRDSSLTFDFQEYLRLKTWMSTTLFSSKDIHFGLPQVKSGY